MVTIPAVFLAGVLAFLSPCFLPVVPALVAQMTPVRRSLRFISEDQPSVSMLVASSRRGGTGQSDGAAQGALPGDAAGAAQGVATIEPAVTIRSAPAANPAANPTANPAAPAENRTANPTSNPAASTRVAAALQALTFVLAFSLVFAAIWAAVGVVGWIVGDFRQVLSIIAGGVLILLGLHVARLIRIPFLDRSMRYDRVDVAGGPSYRKSALLGFSFGLGWSPCIGPILGGVIALATAQGTALKGFALLVVFCLGLGMPFIGCAVLAERVFSFRFVRNHYTTIELLVGVSLIVIGFLMVSGLLERLAASVPAIL